MIQTARTAQCFQSERNDEGRCRDFAVGEPVGFHPDSCSRTTSGVLPAKIFVVLPAPPVEMTQSRDAYEINVELPGVSIAEIDIKVENDRLVIRGEKREQRAEISLDYTRSERSYGVFERQIPLPEDARATAIESIAVDGVLRIRILRDPAARSWRTAAIDRLNRTSDNG